MVGVGSYGWGDVGPLVGVYAVDLDMSDSQGVSRRFCQDVIWRVKERQWNIPNAAMYHRGGRCRHLPIPICSHMLL
jgi:hypothetical protein